MKKVILILAAAGTLATAGAAQASCNVSCLTRRLAAVTRELHRAERVITQNAAVYNRFQSCLSEYSITDYGDPGGAFGYVYNPGAGQATIDTTGLDVTNPGDTIGAWALTDTCNSVTTAFSVSPRHSRRASVAIPLAAAPFGRFTR